MYSQLEFVQSQTKLGQSASGNSHRGDPAVINEAYVLSAVISLLSVNVMGINFLTNQYKVEEY